MKGSLTDSGLPPELVSYMRWRVPGNRKEDGSAMRYVNYSIHLPNPQLLKRIKAAAKQLDVSPSAFIREAAEKAVEQFEKKRRAA